MMRLVRLEELDKIKPFNCGDADLNGFLCEDEDLWRKLRKELPHEKHLGSYPAVKIGRLAVSLQHKGEGLGTDIVSAIKQMLVNNTAVSACRFLTVDAYKDALPFYLKNGFRLLVNNIEDESYTVPMYFDLKELCD